MNREVKINPILSAKNNRKRSPVATQKNSRQHSPSRSSLETNTRTKQKNQSSHSTKKNKINRNRKKSQINFNQPIFGFLALFCRLAIITIGLSTIMGSIIAVANSVNNDLAVNQTASSAPSPTITNSTTSNSKNLFLLLATGQEIAPLKKQLETVTAQYTQLETGVLIVDLASNNYVNLKATETFSSASTIKLPILIAFFQDVDAGKISLTESLTVTQENIAEGSGYMQYQPVGTKYTALQTATSMITVSDNTATNMLIERLGGAKALNKRFASWGLTATQISDRLPDLQGTNTTSPEDLSNLLYRINQGQLVSFNSRDRLLGIMKQTENNSLLPQGLEKGATIAHKTGNIDTILGDTGIVDMPNGKRYLISVLVKRPPEDARAESVIQKISQATYQYFEQQKVSSTTPAPQQQKLRSFISD